MLNSMLRIFWLEVANVFLQVGRQPLNIPETHSKPVSYPLLRENAQNLTSPQDKIKELKNYSAKFNLNIFLSHEGGEEILKFILNNKINFESYKKFLNLPIDNQSVIFTSELSLKLFKDCIKNIDELSAKLKGITTNLDHFFLEGKSYQYMICLLSNPHLHDEIHDHPNIIKTSENNRIRVEIPNTNIRSKL
ncbi:MAG: hypothetical protein J0H68_02635 [Sphingobacteriia bacterium]|nr:hypothetical protein [Sphingobacteriia bacterium]